MNKNFYFSPLTNELKNYITGVTYPDTKSELEITYEDLAYVHVLHYDFNCCVKEGEIICNKIIACDLVDIFYKLFQCRYQIEKICLIDRYGADDLLSMADNNSSAFNYRYISGTKKLSNHSLGLAIDINPLYNPYIFSRDGVQQIQPYNSSDYVDRTKSFPHKIDHDDLCYKFFIEHGFTWVGDWESSKDYQHFEKVD